MTPTRKVLTFSDPEPHGFIYLGFHVQPQKAPLYRQTPQRHEAAARLLEEADELVAAVPQVHSARVFRTHLVPPLDGAPTHDLAMLIRTGSQDAAGTVSQHQQIVDLGGRDILVGDNAARFGHTESDRNAVFLFNHFTVAGDDDPVQAWLSLTRWYASKIGVDNSTALSATGAQQFPLVNYVRLPTSPAAFLLNQILRPSFHRVVRGTLKRNGMRAFPGFYRMM